MMTREEIREEIREGVITNITKACPEMLNKDIVILADKILRDEDSQGVAIKVDGELPPLVSKDIYDKHETAIADEQIKLMLDAGYTTTKPLIG